MGEPAPRRPLEADHRRHAIVEQTIAELKSARLAHLPWGHLMAKDAWLALTVMAHNLGRAVGALAGPDLHVATAATSRRKVFTMPGRLVEPADDDTYDYPTTGHGPTRSPPPSAASTPSRCAAEHQPRPCEQDLGESRQTGSSPLPEPTLQQPVAREPAPSHDAKINGGSGLSRRPSA